MTFLGHACHLVEVAGRRILTDPWLCDPIFEGHAERDPPAAFGVGDLPPLDAVALTHGHLDHFNAPTLERLPDKSIPVVHPPVRFTELDANLRRLGFDNLHARADFEPFELGEARVVPTPSLGVLDECAYLFEDESGRFWNGADAPQPPQVIAEIAARFGPVDCCALSHNSFDQPALLGLPSFKSADHGPAGAAASARGLSAHAAFAAASNLRWCGPAGAEITRKVIRRGPGDLERALASGAPDVAFLDLTPGDAWSREGGIERGVLRGTRDPVSAHDYINALHEPPRRWSPDGRPSTEETFLRDLPKRTAAAPDAAAYVGQPVFVEVEGDDPGAFTVDFRTPGAAGEPGDTGAPYAIRLRDEDWKDLFERRIPWQVLLVSDRLAITRVEHGPPPGGLHFAFALQAIFP